MYEACSDLICEVDPATLNLLFLEEMKKKEKCNRTAEEFPKGTTTNDVVVESKSKK